MERNNLMGWLSLGMWGLYALCFVPFLPTSITYVGLFLVALFGTATALTSIIRRGRYSSIFLMLSVVYLVVFFTSMVTAKYLSASGELSGGAIEKFFKGSALLIGARIDSGDIWAAFTIAYSQFAMPFLVVALAVVAALDIMSRSPKVSAR